MIVPVLALALGLGTAIKTETVSYKDKDGAVLEGVVVVDDAIKGKRPAVVIVHDWMGISKGTLQRATELAQMGYVAFAADIYGKGVRPKDQKEAAAQATIFKTDRALMQRRAQAAVDAVSLRQDVDSAKLAAIGFCFGGTTALELAKSGAPLKGVVSFHGGLDAATAGASKGIKGKVLVLHGADDPYVPQKDIEAFIKDMNEAKVDWQMTSYADTVHSFTDVAAGTDKSKGAAYNERSSKRAFVAMKAFFDELFAG